MYRYHRVGLKRRRRQGSGDGPLVRSAASVRKQVRQALGGGIQTKLTVGAPNDVYEKAADHMAERVMSMPDGAVNTGQAGGQLQRMCTECQEEMEEGKAQRLQRQPIEEEEEEELQPKLREQQLQRQPAAEEDEAEEIQTKAVAEGGAAVSNPVAQGIESRRGGGEPLSPQARAFFEPRFGEGFDQVRVHKDATDNHLAKSVGARAFTLGRDIFFGSGEYTPDAPSGKRLLAHELTHVLQQGQGKDKQEGHLQRKVVGSRVSCDKYPRTYPIFTAIGTTDPVGILQTAVTRAIAMLDDAISELTYTRNQIIAGEPVAWPTISDAVAVSLRDRLRIDPNSRAAWNGTGPRSVHHAIRWYTNIRRILNSDFMRYTCLDPDCSGSDIASAIPGESRIYLCRSFWSDTLDEQAITLIHEASHIYYDTEDSGRGMGSAYCLENFICDLQGVNVCSGCT